MRVSVFGVGYVGVVSCACLAELGHTVIGVDVSEAKVDMLRRGQSPIIEEHIGELIAAGVRDGRISATTDGQAAVRDTDISLVSVGTPSAPDGSVDLAAVEEVIAEIGRAIRAKGAPHAVVMRSTVPPGTAEGRLIPILEREIGAAAGAGVRYYSNPEFLREGTSVRDFREPPFTLIGAAEGDDAAIPRELYGPITAPVHITSWRVAESVKHLSNVYHAVKLAFANEAGAILSEHGVDAREAFRLFSEDKILNISPAYLRPGFAFGGSCLPKDVRGFLALASSRNLQAPFLSRVLPSNRMIIDRAFDMVTRHGRQPVALLGLAFKRGTDDLRESPFVVLAEKLVGRGYDLRIHDPLVRMASLVGSNRAYIEREIPHLDRIMVSSVQEALAGSKIVVIGHLAAADRAAFEAALSDHVVIDLAGIDALKTIPGIRYEGFCG